MADTHEQAPSHFEVYFEAHKWKILVFGILALFLGGGAVVFRQLHKQQALQAGEAFSSASAQSSGANTGPEAVQKSITALEEVIANYKNNMLPAGNAHILLAELYTRQKNFQKAEETLQGFLSLYPKHPLSQQARFSLGTLSYDQGNTEKATQLFTEVVQNGSSKDGLGALAMLWKTDLSAAQEGKQEEAEKNYRTILQKFPGNPFIEQINQRLNTLHSAPPEIIQAPAEPTPTADTTVIKKANPAGDKKKK